MATIKDVARKAGVGVGTASRAISGKGSVSAGTAARVRAAVQALGFRPSSIARALSNRTSGVIGLYVPTFESVYYGPLMRRIDHELREVDRHMIAVNGVGHDDARQMALDATEFLVSRDCDGLIVFSNDLLDEDLLALHQRQPRLVVVNRRVAGLDEECFAIDHETGGRLAARALLAKGHRDIAVIKGPAGVRDSAARLRGFEDELRLHGLSVPPHWHASGNFTPHSGDLAATELMAHKDRAFTAIFVANDVMAVGAMARLHELGMQVPGDVSVVGYDDTELSQYAAPRLSTVHVPAREMTTAAVHHLINRCYGEQRPVAREFQPSFVWRASLGPGPYPPISAAAPTARTTQRPRPKPAGRRKRA